MRMVIVWLHMALDDNKQIIRKNFLSLNKLEIAVRMYKICLLVIVLGFGAPMVSLRVFVQEKVTVRTTRHTSDLPGPCHLMISEYLAPVFQNLYPVDKAIQSWFTVCLTFIRCQWILIYPVDSSTQVLNNLSGQV